MTALLEDRVSVIDDIISSCEQVRRGEHEQIKPGTPVHLTGAESVGDVVCQGDFWIVVAEKIPSKGFKLSPGQVQLVVGNTEGAKHCLNTQSAELVEVYIPEGWDAESLQGPFLNVKGDGVVILHPKHGHVHLVKNTVYECLYQKEWDKMQKAERRSRD